MIKNVLIFLYSFICCANVLSTEPKISKEYYIYVDNKIIYLEMEIPEIEASLGMPDEVVIYKRQDPYHAYDLICWKYGGLWIYFDDIAGYRDYGVNTIAMIAFTQGDGKYSFGNIITGTMTEIEATYGKPSDISYSEESEFIYYQYSIDTFTFKDDGMYYILRFQFDKSMVCIEIVLCSNIFFY
jgi:hypothetical protein